MKEEFNLNIILTFVKKCVGRKIEFIERRTILNDVREGRQASECENFFICKKGVYRKRKEGENKRRTIFL